MTIVSGTRYPLRNGIADNPRQNVPNTMAAAGTDQADTPAITAIMPTAKNPTIITVCVARSMSLPYTANTAIDFGASGTAASILCPISVDTTPSMCFVLP